MGKILVHKVLCEKMPLPQQNKEAYKVFSNYMHCILVNYDHSQLKKIGSTDNNFVLFQIFLKFTIKKWPRMCEKEKETKSILHVYVNYTILS